MDEIFSTWLELLVESIDRIAEAIGDKKFFALLKLLIPPRLRIPPTFQLQHYAATKVSCVCHYVNMSCVCVMSAKLA